MAPLQQELSSLEVEAVQIVEHAPGREGFDPVGSQESSLETLTTLGETEMAALLTGKMPVNSKKCCCCCPCCCCLPFPSCDTLCRCCR